MSQVGRRVISFCFPEGPTRAVRIEGLEEGESVEEVNSNREGPALRRSLNVVGFLRVVAVGALGSVGSETAVASVRVGWRGWWRQDEGGAFRQRSRGAFMAIIVEYGRQQRDRTWGECWKELKE